MQEQWGRAVWHARKDEGYEAMINTVGIIGAGTMGNGIAQICAAAGLSVVMVDISDAAVNRGL